MSNAISALNGRMAPGEVTIREAGLRGMIILRGDLSNKKLRSVCKKLSGVAFPEKGQAFCDGEQGLCWMSPDELLVMVPYAQAADMRNMLSWPLRQICKTAGEPGDTRASIPVPTS